MNESEQIELAKSIVIKEHFKVTGMCVQQFHENIEKWKIVRKYELI